MPAKYTQNRGREIAYRRLLDAGLRSAAHIVRDDVKLRYKSHNWGYLTGEFAHGGKGGVSDTITVSEPHEHNGNRRILIGTNKRSRKGFSYPLAWELGFVPARGVFSPGVGVKHAGPVQFRRVEIWRPALFENRDKIAAAFARHRGPELG